MRTIAETCQYILTLVRQRHESNTGFDFTKTRRQTARSTSISGRTLVSLSDWSCHVPGWHMTCVPRSRW